MKFYCAQLPLPRTIILALGSLCIIGGCIMLCQLFGVMLCPLRRYTGIPCFTCGSTRAILALASGDLKAAFLTQPLIVSLLCCIAPVAMFSFYTALLQKRLFMVSFSLTEKVILGLVLTAVILLNWIYILSTNT